MNKKIAIAAMGFVMSTAFAAPDASSSLNNDVDKLSYSIGFELGKNFKKQGIEINSEKIAAGITQGMNGGQLSMTEEQMKEAIGKFQQELMQKRTAEFNKKAEENKKAGDVFLSQNKLKPDVVTLPSGLQYKIITNGTGAKPGKDATVTVEYSGKLLNGQVFDSTEKTGKPATFQLSQVIPGWTEALQLMPEGSTWEIYVPASLAYGTRNVGEGIIGPNETLIFNIKLLSVKK